MKVDVYFDFAAIFDVSEILVKKGQKFHLVSDTDGVWFSDNDPSLAIVQEGLTAHISADALGKTTLYSMPFEQFAEQKKIVITVVDSISLPASTLGITADEPTQK